MSLDDIREAIEEAMEEGFEVTAEDFEGRDCAYCGDLIPFTEWPENVVTWDIRVQEPGEPKEPYFARYYYCSEECKKKAKHQGQDVEVADPDIIHEDEIDDDTLIADGGVEHEAEPPGMCLGCGLSTAVDPENPASHETTFTEESETETHVRFRCSTCETITAIKKDPEPPVECENCGEDIPPKLQGHHVCESHPLGKAAEPSADNPMEEYR